VIGQITAHRKWAPNRDRVETADWPARERTGELSGETDRNGVKMRKRKYWN